MENRGFIDLGVALLVLALAGCSHNNDGHTHENNASNNGHSHSNNASNNGHSHSNNGSNNGHHHDDMGGAHHDLGTPDVGPDASVQATHYDYCDCMLINCHDPFHDRWGADDVEARNNCANEVSMLPQAGSPQTSGNSFECWAFQCDEVAAGNGSCDDALGAACE